MVERPIKKSERLARAAENETAGTQPSETREDRSSDRGRDRKGGKGKRKGKDERSGDTKPPVNPALMRGPRPPKAAEPVEEPVIDSAPAEDTGVEEPTDAADATAAEEVPA